MNKKDSKTPLTPEEFKARGGFQVSKMKPGVSALIESTVGVMYTVRLADPHNSLIEFYSTDEGMRQHKPMRCYFLASWMDPRGGMVIPDWIVKDGRMHLRFSDSDFLCHPIRAVLLEGPGWNYEVITP